MEKKFFLQRMEERKEGATVVPKRMKEGEDRDRADRMEGFDLELSFFFFFFFSFRTWLANYLASNMKSGGNRSLSGWEEKKGRRAI